MSSLPPDPYKALGVAKNAPLAEIRSAHRKLILKCHPDKIQVQDPELIAQKADEFQKVQAAYEILSNENERQKYDDQVKMAELRRQLASKANTSSPRTMPKHTEYEIRTPEPRSASYKTPGSAPRSKTYTTTYSRSWDDEPGPGPRIFETEIRTSSRRETSYTEKHSKRDREKEKDRERRKRDEEDARYREKVAEKQQKEQRRQEKKQREKARDKEIKRESEKKKEHAKPYVEPYDEDSSTPKPEKKKSSSKKYEEKRERSSHREEAGAPMPPMPPQTTDNDKLDYAASYIEAARSKRGFSRSATYHASRSDKPPVPTPPMPAGQTSAFPIPDDDDVRRSSARTRRGSSEAPRMGREKSYRKASRDHLDDEIFVVHTSPKSRHAAQFDGSVPLSSSPRSGGLPRTNTMPTETGYSRPIPVPVSRSQTFGGYGEGAGSLPRGRERSRMQAQVEESEDSEEAFEPSHQRRRSDRSDRKHRSGRKQRSPSREQTTSRYQVNDGRATLSGSYSRHVAPEIEVEGLRYYPTGRSTGASRVDTSRPPQSRGASYLSTHGGAKYTKVKESKSYNFDDVQYSDYTQQYGREHPVALA